MESRQPNEKSVLQYLLELENLGLVRELLLPSMDVNNIIHFARTCRSANSIFKGPLQIAKSAHYIIVKPSIIEIKKIFDIMNPDSLKIFLQKKVKNVLNHSHQTIINSTLLQLAYGAGDDEMCLLLKFYFEYAFGSKEAAIKEIRKQLNEKFAEGNEEEKKQKEAHDLEIKNHLAELLAAVIQAITNEQFNHGRDADNKLILSPITLIAITTFREALDSLHPKIIDKGKHFRSNTLQEIYDAYADAAVQWRYDYNRCALFEDGVLSSTLSYMPENDAEKFNQGLYYLYKIPPEPFVRSLTLWKGNNNFYDYLCSASSDFSNLSGSCVDILYGTRAVRELSGEDVSWRPSPGATIHQHLCQTKTTNLQSLCESPDNIKRLNQGT